jgi:hypothetical protein
MRKKTAVKSKPTVQKVLPEEAEGLDLTDVFDATDGLGISLNAFKKGDLCIDCFMDQLKQVDKMLRQWGVSILLKQEMISKRYPKAISELMEQLREIGGRLYYTGNRKCA